jgi:hypothetical protein
MSEENVDKGNSCKRTYANAVKTPSPNKHRDLKNTPPKFADEDEDKMQMIEDQQNVILFWMTESSNELSSWISKTTDMIIEVSKAKTLKDLAEFVMAKELTGYDFRAVNIWLQKNFPSKNLQDDLKMCQDMLIPYIFGAMSYNREYFLKSIKIACSIHNVANYSEENLRCRLYKVLNLKDSSHGHRGMLCYKTVCSIVFGTDEDAWNNYLKKRVTRAIQSAGGTALQSKDSFFLHSENFLVYVLFRACPSYFLLDNLLKIVISLSIGTTKEIVESRLVSYEENIEKIIDTIGHLRIEDREVEMLRALISKASINQTTILQYDFMLKLATEITSFSAQSIINLFLSTQGRLEVHIFPICFCNSGLKVSIQVENGYSLIVLSCQNVHIALCFLVKETDALSVERICRSRLGNISLEKAYLGGCMKSTTPNGALMICSPEKQLLKDLLVPYLRRKISNLRSSQSVRNDLALDIFSWRFSAQLIELFFQDIKKCHELPLVNSELEKKHFFPLLQFLKSDEKGLLAKYDKKLLNSLKEIKLGKHLTCLMSLMGQKWVSQLFSDPEPKYILAGIFYDNRNGYLYVDIPGGKRELGESAIESAMRETGEEMSFSVNAFNEAHNINNTLNSIGKNDQMKMEYFMLTLHH